MDGDSARERDAEDNDSSRSVAGLNGDMGDTDRDGATSLLNTSAYTMYDVNQMRIQNKQMKLDLQAEQDQVNQLRKRLNTAEKQRLEGTSQHNKEIGSLENQLAKLRAQIEKGEATRHNIEFELTKAQREITQQKQQQSQREASLQESVNDLKGKVSDLTDELKRTQLQLNSAKDNASDQERRLRAEAAEKDQETARLQTDLDSCRNEKDNLVGICKQQDATINEFGNKVHMFETEYKNQSDDLRRAASEIKFCKDREERLKKDLETAVVKIKTLDETVEAERAAHLETKFNSEIVQLRVRDLEGGLEVEKSANTEANRAVERVTKQLKELEQMYDEERKVKKDLMGKLDRTEKEYLATRRQLSGEVEEKKTVIGSLSKELEGHQKNFNELKTELGKAKKRQAYLEDTYGTAFKELEFLLLNYETGMEDKAKKPKLTGPKKEEAKTKKTQAPGVVVENLKQTLMAYRRKQETMSEELSKLKKTSEKQAKELESCRDMIKSKDKSLEDAHKNYTRTAKELNKARASYGELEGMVGKLRSSLENTASSQGKDRSRIQELSEEIMKLVKRQKQENEEKQAFLQGLHQRLLAGRVLMGQQDKAFSQLPWEDLTHMVYQQVGTTVDALNRAEEKLKNLTDNLKSRDEVVGELQRQHEEQLSRLTQLAKEREEAWTKQKEEMEQHYAQLLSDLQSRSKKSQAMADQAWEKMRATGSVQQGLEAECLALRQQLGETDTRARNLLTACALLCGALYPLYARTNALAVQRHILEDQMTVWDNCRERARYLVNVLNTELMQSPDTPERDRRPGQQRNRLLQFRVGAITIMAAHRLIRLGRQCCRCFVSYDSVSAGNGILVCTGGLKLQQIHGGALGPDGDQSTMEDSELTLPPTSSAPQGQTQLLGWLTNTALSDTVLACMADVTDAAHRIKDEGEAVEHRALVAAAKSSFSKLMDHLSQFFPSVGLHPVAAARDRRSLAGRLGRTLARRLQGKSVVEKDCVVSSQELLIALQNHILDFTQRLHTVEVERRQLLKELGGLKTQIAGLGSICEGPLPSSGDQSVKLITMDKFERVCEELNEALKREQTAQQLLNEQSRQLQELTMRLDHSDTQGAQKQQTLSEAMTGLGELKEDNRRKDQELKQSRKQAMQYEFQRKSLQANLRDAEDALRTAAKDKEILAHYIQCVEQALGEAKKRLVFAKDSSHKSSSTDSTITLSKLLLNADLIPTDIGKAGPELIACQNLVGAFVDLHHQSLARVRTLEEETASLQQHVNSLKRELSDAVHREFNEQDLPTHDEYDLTPSVSHTDISGRDDFRPLREDSEISASMTSVSGIAEKSSGSKSAFKTVKAPAGFQTPKMASSKSRSRQPVPGHR